MNARLILITGAPASGKTVLASRLSVQFDCCCCSKDEIKELLFDTLGSGDAQWSRRLSDASFALLFAFARRLGTSTRTLLLEGNFRNGEHELPLRVLFAERPRAIAQILCEADAPIRRMRLNRRAEEAARHPGHGDARTEVHAGAASDFLDLPGARFRFDSGREAQAQYLQLARAIDQWLTA